MHGSLSPTTRGFTLVKIVALSIAAAWTVAAPRSVGAQSAGTTRPMTFLDMQQMRQVSSPVPSPDGRWLLYTLSTPD